MQGRTPAPPPAQLASPAIQLAAAAQPLDPDLLVSMQQLQPAAADAVTFALAAVPAQPIGDAIANAYVNFASFLGYNVCLVAHAISFLPFVGGLLGSGLVNLYDFGAYVVGNLVFSVSGPDYYGYYPYGPPYGPHGPYGPPYGPYGPYGPHGACGPYGPYGPYDYPYGPYDGYAAAEMHDAAAAAHGVAAVDPTAALDASIAQDVNAVAGALSDVGADVGAMLSSLIP